ncbi:MAG: helix-turn-helix domain-containing protein [Tsuneonella sp.]
MSIDARFDVPDTSDQRGAIRRTLRLGVIGRFAEGQSTATIHNISATGMLVESDATLVEGETIAVDLPQTGERIASVVWVDAPMYGCRFDEPLSTAALSAAQLRGAVRGGSDSNALPVAEAFGARLHRLRVERGMSLSDVADKLGVSKPTVWAWEHGKARPVERRLTALADALGVTPGGLEPATSGPVEAVELGRRQIAEAYGVEPARVRIMIEL